MKFIPMLFSTDMVQALQEDRKTETRRTRGLDLVNDEPGRYVLVGDSRTLDIPRVAKKYDDAIYFMWHTQNSNATSYVCKCPYGKPGDVIWVRETWCHNDDDGVNDEFSYKADYPNAKGWRSSMHMPKTAARTFLEIVEIKVERLRSITQGASSREGVKVQGYFSPLSAFIALWNRINGTGAFDKNPWVWVVKFKKVDRPAKFNAK